LSVVKGDTKRAQSEQTEQHQHKQPTLTQFHELHKSFSSDHPKQIAMTRNLVAMVCRDLQPLDVVNDMGFRKLMNVAEPRFVMPTRKTLSNNIIPEMYKELKVKVNADLTKACTYGMALTTDAWTCRSTNSYICYTGHCLDETFTMMDYCLKVVDFDDRHTAANLAKDLTDTVAQCMPDPNYLPVYVVTDNAANITAAVRSLAPRFIHVPCFAHTLQLCIGDAVSQFPEIESVTTKSKHITTHFRHSYVATTKLLEVEKQLGIQPLKLKQECVTRWNSRYYMFERMIAVKQALSAAIVDTNVANPVADEWTLLQAAAVC
jgi:hypothetical protein